MQTVMVPLKLIHLRTETLHPPIKYSESRYYLFATVILYSFVVSHKVVQTLFLGVLKLDKLYVITSFLICM